MMIAEALISIVGMAGSVGAFCLAWVGYHRSIKTAEPDDKLVERFVKTAPLHLLEDLGDVSKSTLRR